METTFPHGSDGNNGSEGQQAREMWVSTTHFPLNVLQLSGFKRLDDFREYEPVGFVPMIKLKNQPG